MKSILYMLQFADILLFVLLSFAVLYLLFFAVLSKFYKPKCYPITKTNNRFLVLFPAYKADYIITKSIKSFLKQSYPKNTYEIAVIADKMTEETCIELQQLGVIVLKATYENSSKAKALKLAIEKIENNKFDMIVIMDADNTTVPHFLQELNRMYNSGSLVIQAHRTAKNINTDIALLDAASEEINNSIFRSGHIAAGLSASLIGSGFAIDYKWFIDHVFKLQTSGEDKELEAMILKEGLKIDYLSWVNVYDEKTQKQKSIALQRRRWIATQFYALQHSIKDLPSALKKRNFSYVDKIIQWTIPPRLIQIASIVFMCIALTIIDFFINDALNLSFKWWILLIMQIAALLIAIPQPLLNKKMLKAILKIPILTFLMIANLFHLKGMNNIFIHTEHENHP